MRLAVLLVLVSGCVHTQPAALDTPEGRADLNTRTSGRVATLHLPDGRHAVRDLHIGPDETTWVDRLTGAPRSAPTADVTAVSLSRQRVRKGALIGAGIGAAAGLLFSAVENCTGFFCLTPAGNVALFGLDGLIIGAGIGAGQTDRYRVGPGPTLGVRLDSLGRP